MSDRKERKGQKKRGRIGKTGEREKEGNAYIRETTISSESDVLSILDRQVTWICAIESTGDPRDLLVSRLCELLARGERSESLLASDDDACVSRDPFPYASHELRVQLHVLVTQPPTTHAEGGHLLEKATRTRVVVNHEKWNFDCILNGSLLHLLWWANVQKRPTILRRRRKRGVCVCVKVRI